MHKSSSRRWLILSLLFLLTCFIWTSFYGMNFGVQWDETRGQFDSIRDSLKNGIMMQGSDLSEEGTNYNHGGVNYLLTWSGMTPQVLHFLIYGPRNLSTLHSRIMPILYSTGVRIRVRAIYAVLSSLSIVWVFCLCLLFGRSRLEAFLAAALMTFSWEVAYHSRWIAPDVIVMQFVWLSLLCLIAAERSRRKLGWLYFGSIVVGLTAGTKFTGGLMLPFFLAGAGYVFWQESRPKRYILKHCLGFIGVVGLVFMLTNPGVFVDPFRFFYQLKEQNEIYSTGWYGYTVKPGLFHILEMLKYFALQLFSHFWSIALVFAAFCVLGLVVLARERKPWILLMAAFCAFYLAFFSFQAAMMVRNLLVVVPLLAMSGARGIVVVAERVRFPAAKAALYAAVGVMLGVNLGWQIYAARQIKIRFHPDLYLTQFADYTAKSKDTFLISTKLLSAMQAVGRPPGANVARDSGAEHTKIAFFQSEGPDRLWESWPSNVWGMYETTFGPLEVNLEAYSTFVGNERILVVSKERFEDLPVREKDLVGP